MTETYHGFIDTAYDALLIFEACCNGLLPRVPRRFTDRERQTIRSGAVYVWDEDETGMRRWTDGRTWSPSRVHGCFLIYYELEGRRHQFVNRNHGGRSSRSSPRSGQKEKSPLHVSYDPCPPNVMQKEQGLIKKALSLCTNDKHKLHLVCYYSREDVENGCLMSPTNDPRFAGIQVYEDRYPEISHGSGRLDRSGGGRARSLANSRQWRQMADYPGRQPIYARPRTQQPEIYRYPSYGPYAGPVRHVNVSAAPVYSQPYSVSITAASQQLPDEIQHAQYPSPPIWQHSEPPKIYAAPHSGSLRRGSHMAASEPAIPTIGTAPVSSSHVPHHIEQQQQQQPPLPHSPSTIRLPSIENIGASTPQKLPLASRGEPKMNSEDIRQLASLRMSLHQWG
ncbi:Gluconate transport-inducing protein [Coemansia brasiliensis]|uniref:Gluconate transport-inducing protein n=1 Tax=Coemansia brasiliensis TaxID=2650707 RepID=A0A9W8I8J5_9FUNG|nr:Gluconate transport-inducing protein [Coemansia brasiliensis]